MQLLPGDSNMGSLSNAEIDHHFCSIVCEDENGSSIVRFYNVCIVICIGRVYVNVHGFTRPFPLHGLLYRRTNPRPCVITVA